jgi:hypothetical protein
VAIFIVGLVVAAIGGGIYSQIDPAYPKRSEGNLSIAVLMAVVSGVCFLISLVTLPAWVGNVRFNRRDYPTLYYQWRRTWICLRCGARFIPTRRTTHLTDRDVVAGNGMWKVEGVDRETRFETVVYIRASSLEAAKVKAELEGVVVTKVDPAR